jgi:TetR/AcrR family transcriptional regulator
MVGGMQRARQDWQKEARYNALLDATHALMRETAMSLPSMADVAKKAGLAKGTLYLYFDTREDLFLALYNRSLKINVDTALAVLNAMPKPFTAEAVVNAVLEHLLKDTMLMRLAVSATNVAVEQQDAIQDHVNQFRDALYVLGQAIESGMPQLAKGEGRSRVRKTYAYLLGLWNMFGQPLGPVPGDGAGDKRWMLFQEELRSGCMALWRTD